MKTLLQLCVPLLVLCLSLSGRAGADEPKRYACDPCGMSCDTTVYDKPGTCPVCGARLVDQKTAEAKRATRSTSGKVAILIFDGVEIIDYTGPWEVFGAADYEVYTVAGTKGPVTTAMGMTVVPKYTFADAPAPDVLLVPGGNIEGPLGSAATLKWVRDTSARAQHTLSVCNGAFTLATAGLLDGLGATTTAHLLDKLRKDFPKVRVVDDQRFVDNGRIITSGGLSSGIDGALHVVSRMLGNGTAQAVALGLEYDWRPQGGFARGALADRNIPDLDLDVIQGWTTVKTEGGTDHWEIVARVRTELSAASLLDRLGRALTTQANWIGVTGAASAPSSSDWKFSGRDGKPWTGALSVEAVPGRTGEYRTRLTIARQGSSAEAARRSSLQGSAPACPPERTR